MIASRSGSCPRILSNLQRPQDKFLPETLIWKTLFYRDPLSVILIPVAFASPNNLLEMPIVEPCESLLAQLSGKILFLGASVKGLAFKSVD